MEKKTRRARELRRDVCRAEKICREQVRAHRMEGIKFRRQYPSCQYPSCQYPIGPYFTDIACAAKTPAIEIDGTMPIEARQTRVKQARVEQR
ncbi:MAG: DUF559 domain-containing protein [Proteobacteria bacterium]|nr:DUF559 domain-containing protein [Pseudomonadota bacterium]